MCASSPTIVGKDSRVLAVHLILCERLTTLWEGTSTALRSPAAVTAATRTPASRRAAGTTAQAGSSQLAASLEQPITQPIPPLREHAHHLPHVPIGFGHEIQGFDQIPGLFAIQCQWRPVVAVQFQLPLQTEGQDPVNLRARVDVASTGQICKLEQVAIGHVVHSDSECGCDGEHSLGSQAPPQGYVSPRTRRIASPCSLRGQHRTPLNGARPNGPEKVPRSPCHTAPLIARVGSGPAPDVEPDDQPNAAASPARIPTAPSVTTSHVDLQSSSCRTRLPEHHPPDRETLKCQTPLA